MWLIKFKYIGILLISLWIVVSLYIFLPKLVHNTNYDNFFIAEQQILNLQKQNEQLLKLLENLKLQSTTKGLSQNILLTDINDYLQSPNKYFNQFATSSALKRAYFQRKISFALEHLYNFVNVRLTDFNSSLNYEFMQQHVTSIDSDINLAPTQQSLNNRLYQIGVFIKESISDMQSQTELLRDASNEEWRDELNTRVSDLVQRRILYNQNPSNCSSARKLLCHLDKPCGFGCEIHHLIYCLVVAYSTQRMLILDSTNWKYDSAGFEHEFLPLSKTCADYKLPTTTDNPIPGWKGDKDAQSDVPLLQLPIIDVLSPTSSYLPLAIPRDLAPLIAAFHGKPHAWWVGQFVNYILRPNKQLSATIDKYTASIGFKRPIVGIHVRRTDKIGTEATFHDISEYMKWVDHYYDVIDLKQTYNAYATNGRFKSLFAAKTDKDSLANDAQPEKVKRHVYIATDDLNVLVEARRRYPNYEIIGNQDAAKSADTSNRYSLSGLIGVYLDIYFLSRSDYLVCTFSSQVCRIAYELMNSHFKNDRSDAYYSLDDIYYYGGGTGIQSRALRDYIPPQDLYNPTELINSFAKHPNKAYRDDAPLGAGSLLSLYGDEHNGYSLGKDLTNSYNSKGGENRPNSPKFKQLAAKYGLNMPDKALYPSAILEEVPNIVDFPTYFPQVKAENENTIKQRSNGHK